MKALLPLALVLVTAASLSTAHAQLQTFDTRPDYVGDVQTFSATGSKGQIFTNVSTVQQMTYNFFAGSGGNSIPTNLTATFGQWSGSALVAGTTVNFGTISIPAATSGLWSPTLTNGAPSNTFANFAYTFDLRGLSSTLIDPYWGYVTDATKQYALILTNTSGQNTGLGMGIIDSSEVDAFTYGYARLAPGSDWTFAQIVVAPGDVALLMPIPESSTVAALAGATFLTGLVIKRRRQKSVAAVASASA